MLQIKILRRLVAVAGLWMTASACLAAPQPRGAMPLGQVALPPTGYVAFCQRRPEACGEDSQAVLEAARRAVQERTALLAPATVQPAPAAVRGAKADVVLAAITPDGILETLPEPMSAVIERAPVLGHVDLITPAARAATARPAPPRLTPKLWAALNRVNANVNNAIQQQADVAAWGRDDYWTTPLQDGRAVGDCEDFVLEKRRALVEAGVPTSALNIAVVTTSWGETHAVLLVATTKGEFVLDNLSPWVVPWKQAPYRWGQRQVSGEAFRWVMAAQPRPDPTSRDRGGLLLAALR